MVYSMVKIKEENIPLAKELLNEEQSIAFDKILAFLKSDTSEYILLEGYAGVGKTFLISKIVSCIEDRMAMTAPTNKAVKVLVQMAKKEGLEKVEFATIHNLLALTIKLEFPKSEAEGTEPRQVLKRNTFKEPTLNDYHVIFIDEVSMLTEELMCMIDSEKDYKLKIIFIGDPAQIPPVGEIDALPLTEEGRRRYDIDKISLTKIMRQAEGNTIIQVATEIRNNRFTNKDWTRSETDNVHIFNSNNQEQRITFSNLMLQHFTSVYFFENSNYCKTIAWTNKIVDAINAMVRGAIFSGIKDIPSIMVGERLIADKPVFDEDTIILQTSDEFEVLECTDTIYTYVPPVEEDVSLEVPADLFGEKIGEKRYFIKYYIARVSYRESEHLNPRELTIWILHPEGSQPLKWALQYLYNRQMYREYYRLSNMFAKVKYNYAITAHKSQGSTYENVFIIEDDLDKNFKNLERNRIKYTAFTRPKNNLYILSKNN